MGGVNGTRPSVPLSLRALALILGALSLAASLDFAANAWGVEPVDAAPELGRLAPDFRLPDLAGVRVRLADFHGKRAVLINFWATWCPPCRREMPTLEQLAKTRRETLQVLGVNLDPVNPANVRAFVRELGLTFHPPQPRSGGRTDLPDTWPPDLLRGGPGRGGAVPRGWLPRLDRPGIAIHHR